MASKNRTGNSMANQTAGHGTRRNQSDPQTNSERSNNHRGGDQDRKDRDQATQNPGRATAHERVRESTDIERGDGA
jgi:hypothetical protein